VTFRHDLRASDQGGAWWVKSNTPLGYHVTTRFGYVTGLAAVRNRVLYVRQARSDLAMVLAAVPEADVPENVRQPLSEVVAWLIGIGP
jgi:hypothetical protein